MLNPPDFCDLCNKWKTVVREEGLYRDVYNGNVWNCFKGLNGELFFSGVYTYGLMLNIDWFQPCQHTQYSLGATLVLIDLSW